MCTSRLSLARHPPRCKLVQVAALGVYVEEKLQPSEEQSRCLRRLLLFAVGATAAAAAALSAVSPWSGRLWALLNPSYTKEHMRERAASAPVERTMPRAVILAEGAEGVEALNKMLGSYVIVAIIASVSEHQPTAWSSFMFDLHCLCFLFPVGMYYCFKNLTDGKIFIVMYGMFSVYFAGVMVRIP
eukprot:SAG11_NODE_3354_length_2506_cov_0.999585_2_plen_186_part_00